MNGEITSSRHRAAAAIATVMLSVVVVGVAGLFLLSGNGSGSATPPPVTTSSAAPTSASPTPSGPEVEVPVLPAEAKEPTTKGAAAFFRYFWETYNYAFATLDTAPLEAASASECTFCSSALNTVRTVEANGSRIEGGQVAVRAAVARPGNARRPGLVVNSQLRQAKSRTVGADGSVRDSTEQSERRLDALVRWEGGAWLLVGVDTPTG